MQRGASCCLFPGSNSEQTYRRPSRLDHSNKPRPPSIHPPPPPDEARWADGRHRLRQVHSVPLAGSTAGHRCARRRRHRACRGAAGAWVGDRPTAEHRVPLLFARLVTPPGCLLAMQGRWGYRRVLQTFGAGILRSDGGCRAPAVVSLPAAAATSVGGGSFARRSKRCPGPPCPGLQVRSTARRWQHACLRTPAHGGAWRPPPFRR